MVPDRSRPRLMAVYTVLCAALALGGASEVYGQGDDAEAAEGAPFLLLPVGAQGVALGRAMTSVKGAESAFWNPAGLTSVDRRRIMVYRGSTLAGDQTAFSVVLFRPELGSAAISYQLLDIGDQELRDRDGQLLGTISLRSHLGIASFATELSDKLTAGLNFKVLQFRQSCRGLCADAGVTATSYAVDVGLQSEPFRNLPLRLGAMVAHLGPKLQFINAEQADPLPSRLRFSAAYQVLDAITADERFELWIHLETQDRLRSPGEPSLYVGAELGAGTDEIVFVRAGYVLGELDQTDGAAIGLGLRFDRFDLGIARSLAAADIGQESEPFYLTLGLAF